MVMIFLRARTLGVGDDDFILPAWKFAMVIIYSDSACLLLVVVI